MGVRKLAVSVTTASDGTATAYSPYFSGKIERVEYVKNDYANGVDFTMTLEATGEGVWTEANVNASAVRVPRADTHGITGAAALFAAGGTAVQRRIAVGRDRVKIVLAQGGSAKTGVFNFIVSDR